MSRTATSPGSRTSMTAGWRTLRTQRGVRTAADAPAWSTGCGPYDQGGRRRSIVVGMERPQESVHPDGSTRTLAFLFTDLAGSTQLWERFPDAMKGALRRHDAILREAIEGSGGRVVKTTGDGMMAVFESAVDG